MKTVTVNEVKEHPRIIAYLKGADRYLGAIGYTEHSFRHANLVSSIAGNVVQRLGYPKRLAELAEIAGYVHDIGNVIAREFHGSTAALLVEDPLYQLGMAPDEVAMIMNAIANHEEEYGVTSSEVCAAVALGDKSDVHRSRVRTFDPATEDIHDRVNYAAKKSFLRVDADSRTVTLEIEIDTEISQVMEYFEIFLSRMVLCRKAAENLDARFSLVINNTKLL